LSHFVPEKNKKAFTAEIAEKPRALGDQLRARAVACS
jgi:hypothetical protein